MSTMTDEKQETIEVRLSQVNKTYVLTCKLAEVASFRFSPPDVTDHLKEQVIGLVNNPQTERGSNLVIDLGDTDSYIKDIMTVVSCAFRQMQDIGGRLAVVTQGKRLIEKLNTSGIIALIVICRDTQEAIQTLNQQTRR